ncbi:RidA family protein [Epibacterium ulvae]|uniref:RidA family protein n=1 Tax=Epibacterium ulvae TaxID=1156985 RepID=UPI0022B7DB56|nr:RidA family protein [Epibacterium ulvae]
MFDLLRCEDQQTTNRSLRQCPVSGSSSGEQTEAVLQIMKQALEGAGSSMEKVVKVTIYVTDTAHFGPVNEVYERYFSAPYPVRSFIAVDA